MLDLFAGSGSTIMACEQLGRRGFSTEIDQPYCDVVVDRWQRLTGRNAVLDGSGASFEDVARERAPAAEAVSPAAAVTPTSR